MEKNQHTESLVSSEDVGPITVVSVQTRRLTDIGAIAAVANDIRVISRQAEPPVILLDFHRVEHISLDFLNGMKDVKAEIESRGGAICCCSLRPQMRSILKAVGADVLYAGDSPKHALARCITGIQNKKFNLAWAHQ